jgi:hypothetical protein
MSWAGRDPVPKRARARSAGFAFSLAPIAAILGGLLAWYLFDCVSPSGIPAPATLQTGSDAADRLQSLRRSRLAFLNLGFEWGSSVIQGIDEEIAVAECSLKTIRANVSSAPPSQAVPILSERTHAERGAAWIPGSVAGFVLGTAGGLVWRRRTAPQERMGTARTEKDAPLQIPLLGVIPEGAFKDR